MGCGACVYIGPMTRRTPCTPKRRATLLAAIAAGKRVELAAHDAGVSRRTAFEWKAADPTLAAEWDEAYDQATDKLEDVLYNKAAEGDLGALVFSLRSRMPHKYNPALIAKLEMLAIMKAKAAAEAASVPMIEGTVEGTMPTNLHSIAVIALPWNGRMPSPHCALTEDDEPGPIVPVEQDGSGLRLPLPRTVQVELHWDENLPASMLADGERVPPEASSDLWRRVQAWNELLSVAYPESVTKRPPGYADHRIDNDAAPDDNVGDDDDDRPDDSDPAMRGFGE
jgi:hypothetical protein